MANELSWTPVKRGLIYCSPACGAGCKITDFDRATFRANDLAKQLGRGWATHVWENLGWHYEVHKGALRVYAHHDAKVSYMATLGHRAPLQWSAHGATAEEALTALKEKVTHDVSELQAGLTDIGMELKGINILQAPKGSTQAHDRRIGQEAQDE